MQARWSSLGSYCYAKTVPKFAHPPAYNATRKRVGTHLVPTTLERVRRLCSDGDRKPGARGQPGREYLETQERQSCQSRTVHVALLSSAYADIGPTPAVFAGLPANVGARGTGKYWTGEERFSANIRPRHNRLFTFAVFAAIGRLCALTAETAHRTNS